jgi:hypothetical protein
MPTRKDATNILTDAADALAQPFKRDAMSLRFDNGSFMEAACLRPKPDGWSSGSNGTIRRSTRSWLDLAESELGVLAAQCLDRRIADKQTLIDEIAAWEHDRNVSHTKSDWHFTTKSARVKLTKYLYPSI